MWPKVHDRSGCSRRTSFFARIVCLAQSLSEVGAALAALSIRQPACSLRLLSQAARCGTRFIGAERIGPESVPGVGEGAGARAAADVAVLAGAALAVELGGIVQATEDGGVAIYVHQRFNPNIPAPQRQESRGINFAEV